MKTFTYYELSERAQARAINLYYSDADYQSFITKAQEVNPDEMPMVSDWAVAENIRFTEHGERIA